MWVQHLKRLMCNTMKSPGMTVITCCLGLVVLMVAPAFPEGADSPIPFGGYSNDGKCGCYGAKVPIKTIEDARKVIEKFIAGHDLRIGVMTEKPGYFRAELVDGNGTVRDLVIVNKVNGRVRSAY